MAADACPEKGENAEWAASCFKMDKGGRRLKPQHVKHLRFDIACKDCGSVCTELEYQNNIRVDGDGVALGPDGTVRRRFRLPDQKKVCAHAGSVERKAYTGTRPECVLTSSNPFE